MINQQMRKKFLKYLDESEFKPAIAQLASLTAGKREREDYQLLLLNRKFALEKINAIVSVFIQDNIKELSKRRGVDSIIEEADREFRGTHLHAYVDNEAIEWGGKYVYIEMFNDYDFSTKSDMFIILTGLTGTRYTDMVKAATSPLELATKEGLQAVKELDYSFQLQIDCLENERARAISAYKECELLRKGDEDND